MVLMESHSAAILPVIFYLKKIVKSGSDGICPLNVLITFFYLQARYESIPEKSQTCVCLGRKVCLILPFFVLLTS